MSSLENEFDIKGIAWSILDHLIVSFHFFVLGVIEMHIKSVESFFFDSLENTCALFRLGLSDQGQGDFRYPHVMRHP